MALVTFTRSSSNSNSISSDVSIINNFKTIVLIFVNFFSQICVNLLENPYLAFTFFYLANNKYVRLNVLVILNRHNI